MSEGNPSERPQDAVASNERFSPKTRILLIALGFFVFNLVLIAVWAWVLFGR